MGSWGVRAHESDDGLDLLAIAEKRYLRGIKFKIFHIKHITELLRSHIIDNFVKESNGWETQYIDFFYDYTFKYRFAHAVMLIAECLTEYRKKGKYMVYDSKTNRKRKIGEFIFTDKDLECLRADLQSILDPEHCLYDSWKDSDLFDEWKAHIEMLCDALSQVINEGGDGYD